MKFKIGSIVRVANAEVMFDEEYVGETHKVLGTEEIHGVPSYWLEDVSVFMYESQLEEVPDEALNSIHSSLV